MQSQKGKYLFVKNIPAQKLATQSRRAHFLCRTFLALSSTAPPLLFMDIPLPSFPSPHYTKMHNELKTQRVTKINYMRKL